MVLNSNLNHLPLHLLFRFYDHCVKKFRITGFKDPILAARLITIGIYPGKQMSIIRKGLFGGAYYIEIEGSHYALREHEMELIIKVELEEGIDA